MPKRDDFTRFDPDLFGILLRFRKTILQRKLKSFDALVGVIFLGKLY